MSKILVQGKQSFDGKENRPTSEPVCSNATTLSAVSVRSLPTAPRSGAVLGSLFSGLGNCNITISPQNFTVNVGFTSNDASLVSTAIAPAAELDIAGLLHGVDLDAFFRM